MVAIALKSTSRILKFLLVAEGFARRTVTQVSGKVILILHALITLGQNKISVGRTYMLGDKPENKNIY